MSAIKGLNTVVTGISQVSADTITRKSEYCKRLRWLERDRVIVWFL